ncbi:MAG: LapA family protein [Thermodesulfobacteriota bacterium]|nr:LapA family protein [Thermodesulfobacteriota bacterium]
MQFFYWLMLAIVIGVAIFAVQNSSAPLVTMRFLFWKFETSLIYTLLGSMGAGILVALFFWIPRTIKSFIRSKELKKQIENLETVYHGPAPVKAKDE